MKVAAKFSLIATIALVLIAGAAGAAGPDPKAKLANKEVDFSQARSLPFETADQVMFENVLIDNQHYALLASWKRAIMEVKELRLLDTVQIQSATITIDGQDGDWNGILPVVEDPSGDVNPAYPTESGTDLANVYLAQDETYLYGLMTMHNGGPLLDCLYVVELQQYLFQLHTPGDLWIVVNINGGGGWGLSIRDRGPGQNVADYGADYVDVGDGLIEWKVPLVDLENTPYPYFPAGPADRGIENRFIRAYIHPGPHPDPPPVSDENDQMTRPMIINFYQ